MVGALAECNRAQVLAKYRNWPLKVVHGYRGTAETLLALERGEIDGLYSHEGTIQAGRPDLFEGGKIVPVFQSFEELPGVPVITTSATSPQEASLLQLLNSPSQIGLRSSPRPERPRIAYPPCATPIRE